MAESASGWLSETGRAETNGEGVSRQGNPPSHNREGLQVKHRTESQPAQVIKPTKAQDATGWRQPEGRPFPAVGARAYFFDAYARFQEHEWQRVDGTITKVSETQVTIRLDDGRTHTLRRTWVGEA
jgi:hypothetical protein